MLISGSSLLRWGRRTTMTIMMVGSGRWYRAGRRPAAQGDQPHRGPAGPAADTPGPTGTAAGASSPGRLPPQQHPAPPHRPPSAPATPAEVRAWARTHGLPVADR